MPIGVAYVQNPASSAAVPTTDRSVCSSLTVSHNRCTSPLVSADSRTGTRKTFTSTGSFRFCIQTAYYRSPQVFVLNADVSFYCRTNVCMNRNILEKHRSDVEVQNHI